MACHGHKGLVLVLQYCPGGNLSALLQREGHLPEVLSKLYTAEATEEFCIWPHISTENGPVFIA